MSRAAALTLQEDERLIVEAYPSLKPQYRRKAFEWFKFYVEYAASLVVGQKVVAFCSRQKLEAYYAPSIERRGK